MELGNRIKELRKAQNINQDELAEKLFVSRQTISNWENDNIQPSIEMLERLASCLSVTTDYLLGRDDKSYIEVSGLTDTELAHIQQIIDDIRANK